MLHTLHISSHKIFTSKPPILLAWMSISAQEVLLLFFCARDLCQTLSPWVCSPVLPATQSPPNPDQPGSYHFLLTLSWNMQGSHSSQEPCGLSPPRCGLRQVYVFHLMKDISCPLALHLKTTPPSLFSLQNNESSFSSTACVFCSVAKSQSKQGTKPSPWLEMVGRAGKKKINRIKPK